MASTNREHRWLPLLAASGGLGLVLACPANAEGLSLPAGDSPWPQWQARLELPGASLPAPRFTLANPSARALPAPPIRAALLGDYTLGSPTLALPGTRGHFHATSGLLFDLPRAADASGASLAAASDGPVPSSPYLGLGYTGWLPRTGLSFRADVGLAAEYPGGSWRLGRALFGSQGFDATLRELKLEPRLQLGVQYTY